MLTFNRFPEFRVIINATYINYAPIIVAGVVIIGTAYYLLYSHKNYQNPAPHEVGEY